MKRFSLILLFFYLGFFGNNDPFFSVSQQEIIKLKDLSNMDLIRTVQLTTPNYRRRKINKLLGAVIHHTGQYKITSILNTFKDKNSKVSAHVVIAKDGTQYIFEDDRKVLFHAGESFWKQKKNCNYFTLGIELQGDTNIEPIPEKQMKSLMNFLIPRMYQYGWKLEDITDHRTIRENYINEIGKANIKVDLNPIELQRILHKIDQIINIRPLNVRPI